MSQSQAKAIRLQSRRCGHPACAIGRLSRNLAFNLDSVVEQRGQWPWQGSRSSIVIERSVAQKNPARADRSMIARMSDRAVRDFVYLMGKHALADWSVLRSFVHHHDQQCRQVQFSALNRLKHEYLEAVLWPGHCFSVPSNSAAFDQLGVAAVDSEASAASPMFFQVLNRAVFRLHHVPTSGMQRIRRLAPFMIQPMQKVGMVSAGQCRVFPVGVPEATDLLRAMRWEDLTYHLTRWSVATSPGHAGCLDLTSPTSVADHSWTE